jgi:hypothetical protein
MDEARATAQAGLKRVPNHGALHSLLAGIAWNQGDGPTLERELQVTEDCGPDGKMLALNLRAALAAGHGQFRQMRSFMQALQETAVSNNLREAVAGTEVQRSSWEALGGFTSIARQTTERAFNASTSTNVALNSAITLGLLHADQRALKIANDVSVRHPYDTLVQFVTIPLIKSIVAMNSSQPAKAIDLLDGAMVYARSNPGVLYARGLAYLEEKQATQAAQEFQRITDARSVFADPITSLAKLGLARAYALQGDKVKSRVAYQDFFALWKDADPDVPLLKQAKLEYARVQ